MLLQHYYWRVIVGLWSNGLNFILIKIIGMLWSPLPNHRSIGNVHYGAAILIFFILLNISGTTIRVSPVHLSDC